MSAGEAVYMDPGETAVRFARLPPEQNLSFAFGARLNPANPTVLLVNRWKDEGRASLHVMGRDSEGRLRHVVKKLNQQACDLAEAPADAGAGNAADARRAVLRAAGFDGKTLREAEMLLSRIEAIARARQPMPSDADMAAQLGLRGRDRARYLRKRLTEAGLITVWSRGQGPLVVGLAGTGLSTRNDASGADQASLPRDIERAFG